MKVLLKKIIPLILFCLLLTSINPELFLTDLNERNSTSLERYKIESANTEFTTLNQSIDSSIEINDLNDIIPVVETESNAYLNTNNFLKLEETDSLKGIEGDNFVLMDVNGTVLQSIPSISGNFGRVLPINSSSYILYESGNDILFWNMQSNYSAVIPIQGHHDIAFNPTTKTILVLDIYTITKSDVNYVFDELVEYHLNGTKLWSFKTDPYVTLRLDQEPDVTHANSIFWDTENDEIYLNIRNLNIIYKIDHQTGDLIWKLGENGDFNLFNKYGKQKSSLFYHAHGIKMISDDTLILFDNDLNNETDHFNHKSRIVEIQIDELQMKATETWSWDGNEGYYARIMGNAGRLPNGNRYAVFGDQLVSGDDPYIIEVNEDGEIVHKLTIKHSNDQTFRFYQAEKILDTPYISGIEKEDHLFKTEINLNWTIAANSYLPYQSLGSYELILDGSSIQNDSIVFPKYWQLETLKFNLTDLNLGIHNVSLVVYSADGKYSTHTKIIEIRPYFLDKNNLEFIEDGDNVSKLKWNFKSSSNLTVIIEVNESIITQFEGNKTIISINSSDLNLGNNNVTISLYNSSILLFSEEINFEKFPQFAPKFTSTPLELTFEWGDLKELIWNITDISPNRYTLTLDGQLVLNNSWSEVTTLISWPIPHLDENSYSLNLTLYDRIGLNTGWEGQLVIITPNHPVIVSYLANNYQWGLEGTYLNWEIHGANSWVLYKNGLKFKNGTLMENQLSVKIEDWRVEKWYPGRYSIQIVAYDALEQSSMLSSEINIEFITSNPYADTFVEFLSTTVYDGKNALGIPDGKFATISYDYDFGTLVLDMGKNQEIINGPGIDFTLFAIGDYSLEVSNEADSSYVDLGEFTDNQEIDLNSYNISSSRFVKIGYINSGDVKVDAIEAAYFNYVYESKSPEISGPPLITTYSNASSVRISWSVYDAVPWNYSISVESNQVASGIWDIQNVINYDLEINSSLVKVRVTLKVLDIEGNDDIDVVVVNIIPILITYGNTSTNSNPEGISIPNLINGILIGIIIISISIGIIRRKRI